MSDLPEYRVTAAPHPFVVGSNGVDARDHCIAMGPFVILAVKGAGYPAGSGWHPRTAAATQWICAAMNEKMARDGLPGELFP